MWIWLLRRSRRIAIYLFACGFLPLLEWTNTHESSLIYYSLGFWAVGLVILWRNPRPAR